MTHESLRPGTSMMIPWAAHDEHGTTGAWRSLRMLAASERDALGAALAYSAGISLLSLAIPVAAQALVNTVAFGTMLQPLVVLTSLVAAGLVFASVLRALQYVAAEYVQQRLFVRVAMDVGERLARLPLAGARPTAETVNRFFDVVTLQKGVAVLAIDGVLLVLQLAFAMMLLAFYHPWLLAFDIALLLGVLSVLFLVGRPAAYSAIKESKAKYKVAGWLQELAAQPHVFRGAGGAALAARELRERTIHYVHERQRHFRYLLSQWVGGLAISVVASVALLGVGGWLVMNKQLTLGQLVAAELILSAAVASLVKLGKYLETLYDVLAAADKVGQLLSLPEGRQGSHPLPPAGPVGLAFHDVRMPGVARAIRAEVKPGTVTFVTGEAEECRAFMDALFNGECESGTMEVGGVDVRAVDPSSLHGATMLLRDQDLFTGTVAENLCLASSFTFDQMRAALESAGAWRAVMALPQGLDTPLVQGAPSLPPGLRSRVAVARALLHQPRLLLADLHSTDAGLEQALATLAPASTVLVSARKPADGAVTLAIGERA